MNDAALDVGGELAGEVGVAQVAGVGVKHMNRCGNVWAAQRNETLLHVVANWIASGNAADSLSTLYCSEVALGSRNGR